MALSKFAQRTFVPEHEITVRKVTKKINSLLNTNCQHFYDLIGLHMIFVLILNEDVLDYTNPVHPELLEKDVFKSISLSIQSIQFNNKSNIVSILFDESQQNTTEKYIGIKKFDIDNVDARLGLVVKENEVSSDIEPYFFRIR